MLGQWFHFRLPGAGGSRMASTGHAGVGQKSCQGLAWRLGPREGPPSSSLPSLHMAVRVCWVPNRGVPALGCHVLYRFICPNGKFG